MGKFAQSNQALPESRTSAFGTGSSGGGDTASSMSQASINAAVPHSFTPQSVLHQYQRSGVGMSAKDASRRFIGQAMPQQSFNGSTANPASSEKYQALRAMGGY
jgi:hypothetical protein